MSISRAALILAAITAAAPALAARQNSEEPRSIKVSAHDLDLTTTYGKLIFKSRIRAAARDACGREDVVAMQNAGAVSSCYEATLASAMTDANTLIASAERRGAVALAAR